MKLSLRHAGVIVLTLGTLAAAAACADSDPEPYTSPPDDKGDATLPPGNQVDSATEPDATPDAAPRACSVQGFCPTVVPNGETLKGVWGDGTGTAWAVSEQGSVLRWDGAAWNVHASKLGPLNAIWGSSATDVWVAGESGILHGTGASSAALAFTPSTLPEAKTFVLGIWGSSAQDIWAVGYVDNPDTFERSPRALHFAPGDAGPAWSVDPISNEGIAFSHVWGSAGSGVWLGGTRVNAEWITEGVVLRKRGAAPFAEETLPDDPEPNAGLSMLQGAVAASDGLVWVLGRADYYPGIWKGTSADNGATYTWSHRRDGNPAEPFITGVYGTGTGNDVWSVGEYGRVRRGGDPAWTPVAITATKYPIYEPFYGVWSRGTSEVWLVGKGTALRYDPAQVKGGDQ